MDMRQENIPKLQFSSWMKWEDRASYDKKLNPGVYLLAATSKRLESIKPKWKDVAYIGMTNSKGGFASRWRQLSNAINGEKGHSGGTTIFKNLGHHNKWKKKLYVAAMGIDCEVTSQRPIDYKKMGWVAFLEYDAFAKYAKVMKGHPKYNKK